MLPAAPLAQLDRAPDYGSGGLGFESLRACQPFYPNFRQRVEGCAPPTGDTKNRPKSDKPKSNSQGGYHSFFDSGPCVPFTQKVNAFGQAIGQLTPSRLACGPVSLGSRGYSFPEGPLSTD